MNINDLLALVTVGTEEECEAVDYVVCGPASCFPDDVATTCSNCGEPIFHRPHVPTRPKKICLPCCYHQATSEGLPHA